MPGERSQSLNWTEEEDAALRRIVNRELEELERIRASSSHAKNENQPITWVKVASKMNGRNAKQCRERWKNALDPNIRRTVWTPEEDKILMFSQMDIGNKWAQIASLLSGRTENSIKTRYKSILRARKRAWTQAEDEVIMRLVKDQGTQWSQIANALPGRTVNGAKLRHQQLVSGNTKPKYELGMPEQALNEIEAEISRRARMKKTNTSTEKHPSCRSSKYSVAKCLSPATKVCKRSLLAIDSPDEKYLKDMGFGDTTQFHSDNFQMLSKRVCLSPEFSCGESDTSDHFPEYKDAMFDSLNSPRYQQQTGTFVKSQSLNVTSAPCPKAAGGFSSVMAKLLTGVSEKPSITEEPLLPVPQHQRPRSESSVVFDFDVGTYMVDVNLVPQSDNQHRVNQAYLQASS